MQDAPLGLVLVSDTSRLKSYLAVDELMELEEHEKVVFSQVVGRGL